MKKILQLAAWSILFWLKFIVYLAAVVAVPALVIIATGGRENAGAAIAIAFIVWGVDIHHYFKYRRAVFYWGGSFWDRFKGGSGTDAGDIETARFIERVERYRAAVAAEVAGRKANQPPKKEEPAKCPPRIYTAASVDGLTDNGPGSFRHSVESLADEINAAGLPIVLGDRVEDLEKCPHMIIAGTTGSGKSCFLHSVLCGLMLSRSPQTLRLSLCDPKITELTQYRGPHLLHPVATSDEDIFSRLTSICGLITQRYDKMSLYGLRTAPETWARVVVVLEELPALLSRNKRAFLPLVENIAELGRAAGVHLIITAQRPDKTTLGRILQNVPMRVSFRLFSPTDSRTVFGQIKGAGADTLKGAGNGVYYPSHRENEFIRFRAPLITSEEISIIQDSVRLSE